MVLVDCPPTFAVSASQIDGVFLSLFPLVPFVGWDHVMGHKLMLLVIPMRPIDRLIDSYAKFNKWKYGIVEFNENQPSDFRVVDKNEVKQERQQIARAMHAQI
jgi:hypothetical protein